MMLKLEGLILVAHVVGQFVNLLSGVIGGGYSEADQVFRVRLNLGQWPTQETLIIIWPSSTRHHVFCC